MRLPFLSVLLTALLAASAMPAQEIETTPLDDLLLDLANPTELGMGTAPTPAPAIEVIEGQGGELRVLDKLNGAVTNLTLMKGESAQLASLSVTMVACRYPADNPFGDTFAFIEVVDQRDGTLLFSGWMLASAPALNAMDHPRYDVWALRCITS